MERYTLRVPVGGRRDSFRIAYEKELNPRQYEAVMAGEGPLLVVAGAGTGKTRTLVYRVARLVESGVDPGRILLLTFTRRAAGEMLRRASALLDGRCEHVTGGTFHSFANVVLRRYGSRIGIRPNFTILDRGDAEDVVGLLRAELGLDRASRRFPRKQTVASILSASVNKCLSLPELLEAEYPHLLEELPDLERLERRYREYKAEQQLLDYDDLLLRLRELLLADEGVRFRLGDHYRYVLVDEYQDTNLLQAEIVELLACAHRNVTVVGDDAQSIYSFRGANFRNIVEFPNRFPGTRVIRLEENYRSTQPILDVANAILARAREGYRKVLYTRRQGGERPVLFATGTERIQSRLVCQKILELREEGVPLSEMAVLFRAAYHSFDLELELARAGIPFVKRGGFRFAESAHIKDVLAHLRIVANPTDAVSWHRVLLLLEGVGPRTAEVVLRSIRGGRPPAEVLREPGLRGDPAELENLASLYERLGGLSSPGALVEEVLRYYEEILRRRYRDDYPKRERDLEQFAVLAARYRSLDALLADLALEPPVDVKDGRWITEESAEEGVLTLSTVHSAKGLEWDTVFVIWVAEGRFPSLYGFDDPGEVEEERRLLYVAATRAKERLYFVYPTELFERGGNVYWGSVSRFLADIPEDVLRRAVVVEEDVSPGDGSPP
ncbi:MAG: DNA helicase [Candidatus Binatia bacterium]|nr:MAG: DNA helicase [Candidatus Binatia bacterium]